MILAPPLLLTQQEMKRAELRDPRGSFFCEFGDKSERSPRTRQPAPKGTPRERSSEALPQRPKRDRATMITSWKKNGVPADRKEAGGSQGRAAKEEKATVVWGDTACMTPSSGAVVTPITDFEERRQADKVGI